MWGHELSGGKKRHSPKTKFSFVYSTPNPINRKLYIGENN